MRKDFDVIIVGARCAGAGTALLLSRAGARVLVIDKGSYGSDTLSTHALMRGAVMQLARWGVLPCIVKSGVPAVTQTTFGYSTGHVTVAIEPRYGVDALFAPRRSVLDRTLVDEATLAGAHVLFNTPLAELQRDSRGRVTGVTISTTRGPQVLSADLVVGADGLYSTVARQAGAVDVMLGRHKTATLYSYWSDLAIGGYEWHYTADASVGAIPTNDGLACVFVSMPPDQLTATVRPGLVPGYEQFLHTRFPALAKRLSDARRVEPVRGFGGQLGFMKEGAGEGWALVGDAGYFKDPLTAHGITDALRDAELLTRATLSGTSTAFANYGRTRHDLSEGLFSITDQIASFDWAVDELQALHRGFSREMSREQRLLDLLEPFTWQSSPASAPLAV
jgi:2-polyprenyl-6-methoxyphenol hydroxylase-like FAD-dependent oxidoreductase